MGHADQFAARKRIGAARRVTVRIARATWLCLWSLGLAVGSGAQSEPPELDSIESLRLAGTEAGVELQAVSSGVLRLVGVQVEADRTLVIQLPRHLPGPGVDDFFPPDGLVSSVRLVSETTSRGPLTRLRVQTRREVEHTVSSEGSLLRVHLWPRGSAPLPEPEVAELRRKVDEIQQSLSKSEEARGELARKAETLEVENRTLVRRFEAIEARRVELDGSMQATLGEATALLRDLAARNDELTEELRRAESRQSALRAQVEEMRASLSAAASSRQDLEDRLAAALAESAQLARHAEARAARELELSSALDASRIEIERLEQESTALADELGGRLTDAAEREDALRGQLERLRSALADLQPALAREPAETTGVLTRVSADDGYEGWVHADADAGENLEVTELRQALDAAREEMLRIQADSLASEEQLTSRLEAATQERDRLATRLEEIEAAGPSSNPGDQVAAEAGPRRDVTVPIESQPAGRTTGTLFLRAGPGTGYDAIAVLPRGSRVRLLARQGYWIEIEAPGDDRGWISGRYLQLEEGGAELESAIEAAVQAAREAMAKAAVAGASEP